MSDVLQLCYFHLILSSPFFQRNLFLCWILRALGYNVSIITTLGYDLYRYTHLVNIVHYADVDYYVDGSVSPSLCGNIIPLDFERESPLYSFSLWDVKLHKRPSSNGLPIFYFTCHLNVNTESKTTDKYPLIEKEWGVFLSFKLNYRSVYSMQEDWHEAFKRVDIVDVLDSIFIFRLDANLKYVHLFNEHVTQEVENRQRQRYTLDGDDAVRRKVEELMGPQFPQQQIDKAFDIWKRIRD